MKRTSRSLALLSAAAMAGSLALAAPAQAAPARATGETLASHLVGPLSLAVAKSGTVFVTDNFTGTLWAIPKGGKPATVYQATEKHAEVGAVSAYGKKVTFALNGEKKWLMSWKAGALKPTKWANLGAYETKKNPDGDQEYGFVAPTAECAAQWPVKQAGPPTYTGIVDSHPYSSYTTADGAYVGEAGGNAILWVRNDGKIKTVGILPTTEVTVTQAAADELHAPACVGLQYRLEPVPTDVELGPDGWLYISSLPGGPEDDSLGMNGRVYKMNPKNGVVKLVATGFLGTVDLAVANNGDIYVAQLFAGQISKIKAGSAKAKPYIQVALPGAVEWKRDALYATVNALSGNNPKGKVMRFPF